MTLRTTRAASADAPRRAARTVELWLARSSQGYSGKGTKSTGYEHHHVRLIDGTLKIDSEVAFKSFGIHRYTLNVDQKRKTSRFQYGGKEVVVGVTGDDTGWHGRGSFAGKTTGFSVPIPPETGLQSMVGRFLPLMLPRETGELARYVPVPEDGFPWWHPGDRRSWFPLVSGWSPEAIRHGEAPPRIICGLGEEQLRLGRATAVGYRYDHVTDDGTVVATTWIDDEGVLRYEQQGTVLIRVAPEVALSLAPGTE